MVAKKRKSKRQTLQQKFRVIKRVREHKKKLKKGALTNASNHKKKVENRIPNAWPYKEELLKEIQDAKEKMEEQRLRQKEKRREEVVSDGRTLCCAVAANYHITHHDLSVSLYFPG